MMEGCLMLNKMTRFDRDVVSDHVLCYTCFFLCILNFEQSRIGYFIVMVYLF